MRRAFLVASLLSGLAACASPEPAQTFVVFFPESSVRLDDRAKTMVGVAADWAKMHPRLSIVVSGYANPPGSTQADINTSAARAQAVFDQLVGDGVPASRITRTARGPTDYTLSSQENQQVEIRQGKG